jgi:hypoxanthine-guanine phosphoribosyltransferase
MRNVGMVVVGALIFVGKLALAVHSFQSLERVSVATYNYVSGHHAHKEARQGAHL